MSTDINEIFLLKTHLNRQIFNINNRIKIHIPSINPCTILKIKKINIIKNGQLIVQGYTSNDHFNENNFQFLLENEISIYNNYCFNILNIEIIFLYENKYMKWSNRFSLCGISGKFCLKFDEYFNIEFEVLKLLNDHYSRNYIIFKDFKNLTDDFVDLKKIDEMDVKTGFMFISKKYKRHRKVKNDFFYNEVKLDFLETEDDIFFREKKVTLKKYDLSDQITDDWNKFIKKYQNRRKMVKTKYLIYEFLLICTNLKDAAELLIFFYEHSLISLDEMNNILIKINKHKSRK